MLVHLVVLAPGGMGAPISEPKIAMHLPDGSVLQDLLDSFLSRYGSDLIGGSKEYQRQYLFDYMSVSVNSSFVSLDKAREIPLSDNDSVMVIPLIAGG